MDSTSGTADSTTVQVDLTKLRQMLGVAVPSLLVANLAALGVLVAATTPLERPAAATAPAPRQLAVITMPDGTRFLADPSTELGQRAIRAAIAAGGTVRSITAPETSRGRSGGAGGSGGSGEVPLEVPEDDDDGLVPIPEGSALDELIDSLISPVLTIPLPSGDGTTVGDAAAPLIDLLDSTSPTLTALADDDPVSTVSDVVTDQVGTVDSTVSGVLGAVTSTTTTTAPPAASTTTTTAPPTTTTTTPTTCLLILCL
jgi:hypothetical protein